MKPNKELIAELFKSADNLLLSRPETGRLRLCPVKTDLAIMAYGKAMNALWKTATVKPGVESYFKNNPDSFETYVEGQLNSNSSSRTRIGEGDYYGLITEDKALISARRKLGEISRNSDGSYYSASHKDLGVTLKDKRPRPTAAQIDQVNALKKSWKTLTLAEMHAQVKLLEQGLLPSIDR
jgi:hypothetical protein